MVKNFALFFLCMACSVGMLLCFPHIPAWQDALRQQGLFSKAAILKMACCFVLGWLGPWAGLALSAGGLQLAWDSRKPWLAVALLMMLVSLTTAGGHTYYLLHGMHT